MGRPDGVSGQVLHDLIRELYPINRSITGDGVRDSLRLLGRLLPLTIHEVPSGTIAFDWTLPREWNVREAWIKDPSGKKVVDFAESNLHIVGYSIPVHQRMSLAELKPHLHTMPDHPDWIPNRTSYYREAWGFCLSHNRLLGLEDGDYEVLIDSTLTWPSGSMTYGEVEVRGQREEEFLFSAHICHPSLCNDNLSGVAVATHLARHLLSRGPTRWSYRIVFAPGTIGAILWLSRNRERLGRIRGGMTLASLGDPHPLTYKRSLAGDGLVDRAAAYVIGRLGGGAEVIDFSPQGYDERQYNAPGFRIPVGSLMRGRPGQFEEYHTSADNLDFVRPVALGQSLEAAVQIVEVLEADRVWLNRCPYGEPQLGRRGLAGADPDRQLAIAWLLSLADGRHSLLDIAPRTGLDVETLHQTALLLRERGLLEEAEVSGEPSVR